jgi:hypothetical protein
MHRTDENDWKAKYRANRWRFIKEDKSWDNITQTRVEGETSPIPFEEFQKRTFYKLQFASDAAAGKTVRGMNPRSLLFYRFPVTPLTAEEYDQETYGLMWLFGIMTNGNSALKYGYKVEPFYALKKILPKVEIYIDGRGETRIRGEGMTVPTGAMQNLSEPVERAEPLEKPTRLDDAIAVEVVSLDMGEEKEETKE